MSGIQYLIQVNIYLLLFYGFYSLFLKNETFFKLNRIYLLSSGLLSFLIPGMQSDYIRSLFITQKVAKATQTINMEIVTVNFEPQQQSLFNLNNIFLFIYLSGFLFLLSRFIWRLIKINKALKSPEHQQAFSFFSTIKIDPEIQDHDLVLEHELVHAKQWHSADVLIFEIVAIINWFNPVVYLYKQTIKYIHEFMADEIASGQTDNKSDYAMVLLSKTFGIPANQLSNNFFNQSLLKRRIMMLHKSRSARTALIKYGLSAPLFAAMLIFSSATTKQEKIDNYASKINTFSNSLPELLKENLPSQTKQDTTPKGKVYTEVESTPEYPGGIKEFYKYLAENFKYPEEARKNNIKGKVILQFIVEPDGKLDEIKVLRGLGSGVDEEAVRVMQASPEWKAGIQNGRKVRVQYTLPIQVNVNSKEPENNGSGSNQVSDGTIYILDGKEVSATEAKRVDAGNIATVNVMKGESATTAYGEKGKNGVVIISSKKGSGSNVSSAKASGTGSGKISVSNGNTSVNSNDDKMLIKNFEGLILIDGVESDKKTAEKLDPMKIATVNVLKGNSGYEKFGEKAKKGVILIETKKN